MRHYQDKLRSKTYLYDNLCFGILSSQKSRHMKITETSVTMDFTIFQQGYHTSSQFVFIIAGLSVCNYSKFEK